MAVKFSISLTESQDSFVRELVKQGRYSSVSAVIQQGLELLRLQTESENIEIEALRKLLSKRRDGVFISDASMKNRIAAIADNKRRTHLIE